MAKGFRRAIAAAALLIAVPVAAQSYSDSYSFLKAVKERDGAKVTGLLSEPGTIVINSRERGSGESALHIVTRARDYQWLNFLLAKGIRPDLQDQQGASALGIAAQLGWLEGAELLLSRGASVDLANGQGETPLILAVQRRDLAMVRVLLAKGANPKRGDRAAGLSAIDHARRDGARSAAVLKLLEAPAAPAKKVAGPKL
ncbi:MAG TPA: ankyrin repeat domain-containing protein [Allosphingosinicella sp.]